MAVTLAHVGAVIIGRNEGARLATCLGSVCPQLKTVVYVDSGSTDDSLHIAKEFAVEIVNLPPSPPFTAARARNAGVRRLREIAPQVELVQFLDGDCELRPTWLEQAESFLAAHADTAVVCGRRRERYPEATPYNRLCDMEWDTPVGPASACGGDSLMRLSAFEQARGFSDELIAGEEPDLCFRLRQLGWGVHRLDAEMTLHDANMTRAGQWWQRSVRSGYAVAEAYKRRGKHDSELKRQLLSNLIWALPPAWLLWPLLWARVFRKRGALYASHIVLGKLPHLVGQLTFWWRNWQRKPAKLIEYK
jgi:glycosyltransferase involved in cell wall biosynthesis